MPTPEQYIQRLRDDHRANQEAAGLTQPVTPDGPTTTTTSSYGVRVQPAMTDDDLTRAVLAAKAVVALDERCWQLNVEVRRRDEQISRMSRWLARGQAERDRLRGRLHAVTNLHAEAQQQACSDGCCHEGLGTCGHCGESYPCATVRAADGIADASAAA